MEKVLSNPISKFKDMTRNTEAPVNANNVSRISEGTVIKGDMSSLGDIRVDGTVEGKLFSKGRIVVGENAVVTGTLVCTNVDFWGRMEGDIFVREVLSLKGTSVVNGNIHVRKFQVEMGAQVNGSCQMITEADFDKACESEIATKVEEPAAPAKKERKPFINVGQAAVAEAAE